MAIQRSALVTKAQELMKTEWLDYSQAARKVRDSMATTTPASPIANVPVAWQAPSPTVVPTPVATPTTVAPVALENPIEKSPVAPVVTNPANNILPEVKPTTAPVATPKTETPIDFNASAWRETQIQDNVTKITQTNTALLKDRNAYNQAFGYETADQGKKAILDSQFTSSQPVQPTASSMYNAIANKMEIPLDQQSSGAYRVANNRFQRANTYASMTPSQVSQAMNDTKLIEWSQTWEDLKTMNPKLAQDVKALRIVNNNKPNIFTYVNNPDWTPVKVNNLEKQFTEQYNEDHPDIVEQLKKIYATPSYDEMISKINTPEVMAIQDKASSIEWELNTLKTAMESVSKDVETELAWTGATGSRIALEKASRWEALQKQYDAKLRDYTTQYNKANDLINRNTEIYKYSQEQSKAMQSALAWVATEQYKNKLALENSQAEFEQKIAQQAQAMNDPVMAISSMIDEYKKLWVPFTRSTQQVIADFQSSGQDLPTYLSNLQKTIQSKPEYQKIQALQQGQMSDAEKFRMQNEVQDTRDVRNFEQQKELARLNKDLTREQFLFEIENDPTKRAATYELETKLNANKSLYDVLGKNVWTYEGNRGYDLAWKLWDPIPAWGNWKVESVIDASLMSSPYGNSVVMVDENGNKVRYSHLQEIWVKPWDQLWFGDIVWTRGNTWNVKWANGETLTPEQLKAGRWAHVDIEIKDANWRLLSQSEQVDWLKSKKAWTTAPSLTDKQFTQYNQTKTGFKSEPIVKSFEEALIAGGDIIQSLWSENWPWDIGAVFNFMKSLDPTSTVRTEEFQNAAKSAWVWESFKNIPANKLEGTILTDKQRKDFGKLAMKYVESKWKLYDTKYDDMVKVLKNQLIPDTYYPTRMTDYIKQYKWSTDTNVVNSSNQTNIPTAIYSGFENDFSNL